MKKTDSCKCKIPVIVISVFLFLFLQTTTAYAQHRPPFSEKTVKVDDRIFLPFTKGEVVRKIDGSQKTVLDQICSFITAWDSIAPPQGIKVHCSGLDNSLEIYFLPYLFEEGIRYTSEGGPNLHFFLNNPLQMFGSPLVSDIFRCPQKTADFNGFPIYQTDRGEVTILSKKKIPLFIPVSQEEFLNALIKKELKNRDKNPGSDYQSTLTEMEKAYQLLLKNDREAAKEFKQQMDEFKTEMNNSEVNIMDPVTMLEKELSGLSANERARQAWYGGPSAMEASLNLSGLVPYENRENADALVRPNPSLIDKALKGKIQLLVIRWSVGQNTSPDKPRLYNEGRDGFNLANNLMYQLYNSQKVWNNIFNNCIQ